MIRVRLAGHIRTSVGSAEVTLADDELDVAALVEKVRSMCKGSEPGFSKFNTIAMIEDGEAFAPAASSRKARSGDTWVLIPFSHGG